MAHHTVTVTIQDGRIKVDQDTVEIHEDSFLNWKGNEPFTIEFQNGNAFGKSLNHSRATQFMQPRPGYPGTYKYTIISDRDRTIKLDPTIIVQPGPTGTH